jgi:hypothetical protein
MMDRRHFLLGGVAALVLPACGYSLSGRGSFLPASIRTIGVPLFANSTNVYYIEQRVTYRVRAELLGRGRWTVSPITKVTSRPRGEIVRPGSRLPPSTPAAGDPHRLALVALGCHVRRTR